MAEAVDDEKLSEMERDCATGTHTLSVLGLTYLVKAYEGTWWKGCCCRRKAQKTVLRNISMHLQSGEITAVLGSSGSGKTSLLDVIANRTKGKVIGGVYLDNKLMTEDLFRKEAGYVIQADRLLPNLTVKETLNYTAKLKFTDEGMDREAIDVRVEDVISDMGLKHVANSRIGGSIVRGISGGEKRRVSIAVQLLQDPKILLLDEPTTGLDSFNANDLVSSLCELAKKGNKIILMTIHQPRSDLLKLFDHLGILTQGEAVYLGPSQQLVPYFTGLGYSCPTYANPQDHYVDLASIDRRNQQREEPTQELVNNLKMAFVHSTMFSNTLADIHNNTREMDGTVVYTREMPWKFSNNPPGFFYAIWTLLQRMMVNLYRDRSSLIMRCLQFGILAFFLWIYIFRLGNNQESIQDRIGILYQSVQCPAYVGVLNGVALFPVLRDLYYREARDGLYNNIVFLLAYFIHILPFNVISSLVFSTILYWGIGMYPEAERYGIYFLIIFFMHYGGELVGVALMGVIRTPSIASSVGSIILAISGLIATGFLRSIQSMLLIFQYLGWLSIFKYASEVLVANEFHQLELVCDEGSSVPCVIESGDMYINIFYPGAVENLSRNLGITSAFVVGYMILGLFVYQLKGIRNLH